MKGEKLGSYIDAICGYIANKRVHADIREELLSHLEEAVVDKMALGMTEEEAEEQAIANMGDARAVGKQLHRTHRAGIDWSVLVLAILFMALGLAVMRAIMVSDSLRHPISLFESKLPYAFIGIALMIGIAFFDYRKLLRYSWLLYFGVIAVLWWTVLTGIRVGGAYYLTLPFWPRTIEVAMPAALALAIAACGLAVRFRESDLRKNAQAKTTDGKSLKADGPLLRIQLPRLSRELTISGGLPIRLLVFILLPGFSLMGIMSISALLVYGICMFAILLIVKLEGRFAFYAAFLLCGAAYAAKLLGNFYYREQLTSFLHPAQDPLGSNYTLNQSLKLIGQAGLWGHGFAQRVDTLATIYSEAVFPYLIYSFGWVTGGLLAAAAIIFVWRILRAARRSTDGFSKSIAAVIAVYFIVHFFWNMLMMVGWLPQISFSLPFISYGGGQTTIMQGVLIGLLLSVCRLGRTRPSAELREHPSAT